MTLTPWQNFYVILGSAAGALVGLQFVAMVLIADVSFRPDEEISAMEESSAAFATPTIVHFTFVLLLAATMVMPWPTHLAPANNLAASLVANSSGPSSAPLCAAVIGLFGLLYMASVTLRMARQTSYKPVWEDWLFRATLPTVAYLGLALTGILAALLSHLHPTRTLFGIAFSALLLLVMGIHNAWDNVTYIVSMKRNRQDAKADSLRE